MVAVSKAETLPTMPAKPKYPWIGASEKGTIVLFIGRDRGTVVGHTTDAPQEMRSAHPFGLMGGTWDEGRFSWYSGKVTLYNE